MSQTAIAREKASSPSRSTSGLRTYGSPPTSGERALKLPDPAYLEDVVDYEHTDLEDARMAAAEDERLAAAEDARLAAAEPDSSPSLPRPGCLGHGPPSLFRTRQLFPNTSPPLRGSTRGLRRNARRLTKRRALAAAEAFGAAVENTVRLRAQEVSTAVRAVAAAAKATEKTGSASKAAVMASKYAVLSASPAREPSSRAREDWRAARVNSATKALCVAEAGVPAGRLPLAATATTITPVPTPVPGPGTSDQHPSSAIAVDSRSRRPGDLDFMQGSVTCMAAGPNKFLPSAVASAVVSCAPGFRGALPEDDLSVSMAWNQMGTDTWQ